MGALAAALGPSHADVQMLGCACAGRRACGTKVWVVACETCGTQLGDSRFELNPTTKRGPHNVVPKATMLPKAIWCSRCHLAPFCGSQCEAVGVGHHALLCVTSEGYPIK